MIKEIIIGALVLTITVILLVLIIASIAPEDMGISLVNVTRVLA